MSSSITMNLVEVLKENFGYSTFRGNQEKIIQNLLAKKDTFVIMPTGAGKSLCYQLPAIMLEGTAIVISPLIALMKNQVDQLEARGINAHFLNSTLTKREITKVKKEVLDGVTKLLYVAPESLTKEENIEFLKKAKLSFVAVDEVHCISEWGHDFRPEYRRIRSIISMLGDLPIIALTATATPKVRLDIIKNLAMENATLYKGSFFRKNLFYDVRPKVNSKVQLIQFIKQHKGEGGIVYCLSRKKVEELAQFLNVNDINARPYHAGLDPHVREKNQDDFLNEEVDVIVATIAFGMGIDKPDVRFVIHYDAPKSLEGYYQETGRAGRDSKNSHCLMFYNYNDIVKLEKFNKDKAVSERENAHHLLEEVTGYSESARCRTRQLLHYFGEQLDEDCGFCDNCQNPKESYTIENEVTLAIQAVKQTGERFELKHIADVLRGSKGQYVLSHHHNELAVYAKGKSKDSHQWMSILRQLLILDYFKKDIDNYGVVSVSKLGEAFLKNPHPIEILNDHVYPEVNDNDDIAIKDQQQQHQLIHDSHDRVLFELLKTLRKDVAKKNSVPPYVVFQEAAMEEMATSFPMTIESLTHISGVGQGKASKFGKSFIELIKKYVEENDIDVPSDMFVKSKVNKSRNKIQIIQFIDDKIDLEEIADRLNLSYDQIIEEIEHISHSGTKLNLDYYIDSFLDEDKQDDIFDYFMEAETDNIEDALEEFDEEYTEDEIRLMRIRFMSEVAN